MQNPHQLAERVALDGDAATNGPTPTLPDQLTTASADFKDYLLRLEFTRLTVERLLDHADLPADEWMSLLAEHTGGMVTVDDARARAIEMFFESQQVRWPTAIDAQALVSGPTPRITDLLDRLMDVRRQEQRAHQLQTRQRISTPFIDWQKPLIEWRQQGCDQPTVAWRAGLDDSDGALDLCCGLASLPPLGAWLNRCQIPASAWRLSRPLPPTLNRFSAVLLTWVTCASFRQLPEIRVDGFRPGRGVISLLSGLVLSTTGAAIGDPLVAFNGCLVGVNAVRRQAISLHGSDEPEILGRRLNWGRLETLGELLHAVLGAQSRPKSASGERTA